MVVRHGEHHIIADGSHRAAIHAAQGSTHIPAFVTERTIFPKPAPTTGGAMKRENEPCVSRIPSGGLTAAIADAFAGDGPVPALQAEEMLTELPKVYSKVAELLGLMGQRIAEGPLGPTLGEHLASMQMTTSQLAQQAAEAPGILNGAHPDQMSRLHDPAPLEGVTFDLSAQGQGGPKAQGV